MFSHAWKLRYPDVYTGDAFAAAPIQPSGYSAEVIELSPCSGKESSPCSTDDLAKLMAVDLDVIVNLSQSGLAHGIGSAARFGLWAFDLDGTGRAVNCWQRDLARIAQHQHRKVIATEIRVQDGAHRGTILGLGFTGADPARPHRGENRLFWRRAPLLIQRLGVLRENGWDYVASPESPTLHSAAKSRVSRSFAVVTSTIMAVGRASVSLLKREFAHEQWFIAARRSPDSAGPPSNMNGFQVIRPPRDRFYADPFAIEEQGRHYIFIEDYRYALRKGLISHMEIDDQGNCSPAVTILEAAYHLSYPFLFRWEGQIYMMPETSAARRVEVYRAVEFPLRWERHAVIMDNVVGYDPTLLEHDGRFWLFISGVLKHGGENNDLSVFWADHPFGRWHAHPENPVVSDVRRARPAGAIFQTKGELYRPGQDCSVIYGRAVTLNRIEVLSERMYREAPAGRIEPEWFPGNLGTHTFNQDGLIEVIDGRVLVWKLRNDQNSDR